MLPHYCIFSLHCLLSLHPLFFITPSQFPHWWLLSFFSPSPTWPQHVLGGVSLAVCRSPCPGTGWNRLTHCSSALPAASGLSLRGPWSAREAAHPDPAHSWSLPWPWAPPCSWSGDPNHPRRSWSHLSPGTGDTAVCVGSWACSPGPWSTAGDFLLEQKLSISGLCPASQGSTSRSCLIYPVCFMLGK